MPLPKPVPPPVMRMRLCCRRLGSNIRLLRHRIKRTSVILIQKLGLADAPRARELLFFLAHLAANIGPEFLNQERQRVIPYLSSPDLRGVRRSLVGARMIAVRGNGRCSRTAENLGIVKLGMP